MREMTEAVPVVPEWLRDLKVDPLLLKDGGVIVLRSSRLMSREARKNLTKSFDPIITWLDEGFGVRVRVMVQDDGLEMGVLRTKPDA